jgi:gliding motility-associated-like protein
VSNVCSSQLDTVDVTMIPVPTPIYDGAVLTICLDSSIIFNAQNIGSSYLWNTKDTLQKIQINKPGFYTVKITEQHFCSIIDSVHLLMVDCNPGYVFMPNAFSPNGDGFNDNIGPILVGENVKLTGYKIYNRWGNLIFASNDKGMYWDGKCNGVDQLVGTYIYTVDYTNMGVPKLLKGDISLIR